MVVGTNGEGGRAGRGAGVCRFAIWSAVDLPVPDEDNEAGESASIEERETQTLSQTGPGYHIQQAPPVKRVAGKAVVDGDAVALPRTTPHSESRARWVVVWETSRSGRRGAGAVGEEQAGCDDRAKYK